MMSMKEGTKKHPTDQPTMSDSEQQNFQFQFEYLAKC